MLDINHITLPNPFIWYFKLVIKTLIGAVRFVLIVYGLESHTGTQNMRDLLQTTFREVNKHVILMKLYNVSEQVWYHIKENFILC